MPNWCMNELTVSGDAEELKRFVFATQGLPAKYPPQEWEKSFPREEPKDAFFCFNALIPTPEAVLQIGYDGHNKLPKDALRYALTGRPFEPIDGYECYAKLYITFVMISFIKCIVFHNYLLFFKNGKN